VHNLAVFGYCKKLPKGIRTARGDIDVIARRLKLAQQDDEARYGKTNR
jgi:hypothetical protein